MYLVKPVLDALATARGLSYAVPSTLAAASSSQIQSLANATLGAFRGSLKPEGKHLGQWMSLAAAAQAVASLALSALGRLPQRDFSPSSSKPIQDLMMATLGVAGYSSPALGLVISPLLFYQQSQSHQQGNNPFPHWHSDPLMTRVCSAMNPINVSIGQQPIPAAIAALALSGFALANCTTQMNLSLVSLGATLIAAGAGPDRTR